MTREIAYLDYNATAPLRREAREAMQAAFSHVGNPSSVHGPGRRARQVIEAARAEISALLGVPPGFTIFTSGATEANNQALQAARTAGYRLLACATEHESILHQPGLTLVPVTQSGVIDLSALDCVLAKADAPPFLALMAANNETGVLQPVAEAAERVHRAGGLLHCDAVQAAGRIALDILAGQVDSLSISAHKIGGPMGVGALIAAPSLPAHPLLFGGAQESQRRAGTQNVPGIAGFGAAASVALAELPHNTRILALRDALEAGMMETDPACRILGADIARIANTTCVAVPSLPAQTQVMALDLDGLAIGAGSACSSGKVGVSHVLQAMGIAEDLARCAIRVSIGAATEQREIDHFLQSWKRLRARHGRHAA